MKNIKNFYLPLFFSTIIIIIYMFFTPYTQYTSKLSFTDNINTTDELTFYISSDIHYLSKSLTDYGIAFNRFNKNGDGKQLEFICEIFNEFANEIKNRKPDFLILSGDLTLNGEKQSHLDLSSKLAEIKASGVDVYIIPGNHDINNPNARGFKEENQYKTDFVSKEEFINIYQDFGFNDAISKDKSSLSYLVAPSNKLYILMLDDNLYNNNLSINYPEVNGCISKDTLNWINNCGKLAKNNNAKIIAVSHHNIINHSNYIYSGFTLDNSDEVLNTLKNNNIHLCFTGHIHFQSIKSTSLDNSILTDIASSSLAIYPQQYGIATFNKDKSLSYEIATLNMDNFDPSFKSNSKKSFKNFVYNQNFKRLSYSDDYTEEELKAMCETLSNIRLKYNDDSEEISWDSIISSKGFNLLKSCPSPFIKHYVDIALNNKDNNYKNLTIKL
ncbi:metallophosphoesterase [Clostridium disporicum]|uniref:Metallophosphoesterase n=1 Tax=Clostridium disporicum TaxID=84024 RepID=A0A174GL41_9CLOT|nr:metallophosphoesterase [Clostridium disporicum]CUO63073.1 metallophosphoesterase [Clostridium disporicum]